MFQAWLIVLFVTYNALPSGGQVTDVRLVNGPSRYEGTVEYTTDNVMWQTTCGVNFDFHDARLVCEHIGANGTNRAIANSTFGSDLGPPTTFLNCREGDTSIGDCGLFAACSSPDTIGAAICYDETYLGCYKDSRSDRVLSGDPLIEDSTMTIDRCITHCRESTMADYVYAGLEDADQCYCGVAGADYSRLGAADNGDRDCQTHCAGDADSSCGGNDAIAVFQIPETSQLITTPLTSSEDIATSPAAPTTSAVQQSTTTGLSTVSSTHGENGTRPETIYTTDFISPTQSAQLCAHPSNGPFVGLGLVTVLFAIYSVTVTVLLLRTRRSSMEKQPPEGVKPEGDTYTDLDIKLHTPTPENKGPLYQDLLPTEEAPNPPDQSSASRTETDDRCYVNQQMANQQKAMRQRTKPEGDLQHYEDFV